MMIKIKIRIDNGDDKILQRGYYVKKYIRHITKVHFGEGIELDIQSRAKISGSERE